MNQKNTVYIVTGPCGVGKSTVAKKLAQRFDRSSHINGDLIYHMVVGGYTPPWEDDGTLTKLLWSNMSDLARNYAESMYDVVIDYVVFPEHLKYIENLQSKSTVKYIVLMANEETIRKRDKNRLPTHSMGDRAIEVLNEFKEKKIDNRFIIDTSFKDIDEIISEIIEEERFIL